MPTPREPLATRLTDTGPVRAVFWHQDAAAAAGAEPDEWLASEERAEYAALGSEKRRREWFSARVALKAMLVADGLARRPSEITVRKNALGAPRVAIWEPDTFRYAEVGCAISHCAPYVLCAYVPVRGARIGVDVERRTWRLSRLGRKFVSEGDAMLPKDDENGDQTVLWSIKESLSKLLGTGWACGFRNLACVETEPGRCLLTDAAGLEHQGLYRWFGQYVMTLAYDIPEAAAASERTTRHGATGPFAALARIFRNSRRRAALRRRRRERLRLDSPLENPGMENGGAATDHQRATADSAEVPTGAAAMTSGGDDSTPGQPTANDSPAPPTPDTK